MRTIVGYGRPPANLQKDADLEMKLKTLLQSMSLENSKVSLDFKALSSILSIIQTDLELTKGYLAALQGTSQRVCSSPSINPSDLIQTMGHQSVILSECLQMTWNATQTMDSISRSLAPKNG